MSKKKITLKNKDNVTTSTDDSSDNKKKRPTSQSRKVNKVVYVRRGRTCPKHPGRKFKPTQIEVSQTIFDLVFTTRGIKKQVTQYVGKKGNCTACCFEYNPPQIRKLGSGTRYEHGFMAWLSYHRLALRLPFNKISQLIEDTFGEHVNSSTIHGLMKYGLKTRHLRKFRLNVDSFYEKFIDNTVYASNATQTFQKRFIKYRDKLFVFLDKDDIPWNNNTEERAIRHLAVQRKISGTFGKETTSPYLRLLSVTQTCRFQNKSLLQFLLSGEKDIDEFKGRKGLIGWRMR